MAFAETAKLVTELSLKDNLSRGLGKAVGSVKAFDKATSGLQKNLGNLGKDLGRGLRTGIANVVKISTVAVTGLVGALIAVTKAGEGAQKVETIFAKTIANSGKFSAAQVKALRAQQDALLELTGADDEAIKSVQTILIRFGETAAQVQKLTPLVLDLAKATGRDLESSAIAVGKAMTGQFMALTRMGITLTAAQQAALKGTTKSAKLQQLQEEKLRLQQRKSSLESRGALTKVQKLGFARAKASLDARIAQEKLTIAQKKGLTTAQKEAIVYDALKKKVGGVAKSLGQELTGRLDVLREKLANIAEGAGIRLAPALTKLADIAGQTLVPALQKLADQALPHIIDGIKTFTGLLTSANLDKVRAVLGDIAKGIGESIPTIKGAISFSAETLKTAINLFRSLPPDLQKIAIGALAVNKLTGGAAASVIGDLLKIGLSGLRTITAGVVNVFGASVTGVGGAAEAAGIGGVISRIGLAMTAAIAGSVALVSTGLIAQTFNDVKKDINNTIGKALGFGPNIQGGNPLADLNAAADKLDAKRMEDLTKAIDSLKLLDPASRLDPNGTDLKTVGDRLKELNEELKKLKDSPAFNPALNPKIPPPPSIVPPGYIAALKSGITTGLAPMQRALIEQFKAAAALNRAGIFLRIAAQKQIAAAALQRVLKGNLFETSRPLRKGKLSSETLREFGQGKGKLTPKEIVKVAGAGTLALAQGGKGNTEKNIGLLKDVKTRLLKLGDKTDAGAIQRDIEALNQTLINKKLDVQNNNIIQNRITVANDYTITVDGRKVAVIQNQHTDYSSASTAGRQNLPNF